MRPKHPWVIFPLIVILSIIATPARPQGLEIRGTVTGRDGLPKRQVSINLQGPKRFITISNAKGEFVLKGVEPGVYEVSLMQGDKMHKFSLNITGQSLDLRVPW
uniref:Carboxypeptidase regulatory-like domain-containing protein n=1 Tax=Desulfobacca acetoxidans TaxID=60893 RepID=A0A7V4G8D6_9BACT